MVSIVASKRGDKTPGHWVNVQSVKDGASGPKIAASHNLRDAKDLPSNVDSARSHLNRVLVGNKSSANVAAEVQRALMAAGVERRRKNSPHLIEFVFTTPPAKAVNDDYWRACLRWVEGRYLDCPIVSAVVHLDESVPHCHVLVVPLGVTKRKPVLAASKWLGKRGDIYTMRKHFMDEVAKPFGLVGAESDFVAIKRGEMRLPKDKGRHKEDCLSCVGHCRAARAWVLPPYPLRRGTYAEASNVAGYEQPNP